MSITNIIFIKEKVINFAKNILTKIKLSAIIIPLLKLRLSFNYIYLYLLIFDTKESVKLN